MSPIAVFMSKREMWELGPIEAIAEVKRRAEQKAPMRDLHATDIRKTGIGIVVTFEDRAHAA